MVAGRLSVTVVAVGLLVSCSSGESCAAASPTPAVCDDLKYRGQFYNEWAEVDAPRILQEVGDATYPDCNDVGPCGQADPGGHAATDVWLLPGVDREQALIGFREGTETRVVFVRRGVDPATLHPRLPVSPVSSP